MRPAPVLAALGVVFAVHAARAEPLDALLARIEQDVVTWSQAYQEAGLRALAEAGRGEPPDPWGVVDTLVRRSLLVAEAEKLRLEVSPDEVEAAVERLAADGGPEFWARVRALGLDRADLEERARRLALVHRYLELRREMTFVPESQVRSFYTSQLDVLGSRPLSAVRDEVRAYLAEKKFQKELGEWIERQVAEGKVELLEIPPARQP